MESGEDMERKLQLQYDIARAKKLYMLMLEDRDELLEADQASQETFESLQKQNKELKAQLKPYEAVMENQDELLEERRRSLGALKQTQDKVRALQKRTALLEAECERLDEDLFYSTCDLEAVRREKERFRGETVELERRLVKMWRMWPEDGRLEEEIHRRDAAIAQLKDFAENYAEHNRVSQERLKELQERVAAAQEWKEPADHALAEEVAKCEEDEEEQVEEVEQKRESSFVKQRGVLRRILSFAVKLLLLLCCLVLLVTSCSERTAAPGTELLLEAVKAAVEPYCTIHFPEPPPF